MWAEEFYCCICWTDPIFLQAWGRNSKLETTDFLRVVLIWSCRLSEGFNVEQAQFHKLSKVAAGNFRNLDSWKDLYCVETPPHRRPRGPLCSAPNKIVPTCAAWMRINSTFTKSACRTKSPEPLLHLALYTDPCSVYFFFSSDFSRLLLEHRPHTTASLLRISCWAFWRQLLLLTCVFVQFLLAETHRTSRALIRTWQVN